MEEIIYRINPIKHSRSVALGRRGGGGGGGGGFLET